MHFGRGFGHQVRQKRIRSAAQWLGHTFAALQGLLQDPAATLVPGQFQQGTWQPVTSSHTEPGND